jgi:DNA polymerase III subunit alpha
VVFPAVYERHRELLEEGRIVLVDGKLSISEDEGRKSIIAERLHDIDEASKGFKKVYIKLPYDRDIAEIENIKYVLKDYPGDIPVYIYLEKNKKTVKASREFWVSISEESLEERVESLLGAGNIKVV